MTGFILESGADDCQTLPGDEPRIMANFSIRSRAILYFVTVVVDIINFTLLSAVVSRQPLGAFSHGSRREKIRRAR